MTKDKMKWISLKVFQNKRNGQYNVPIPKRNHGKIPERVQVRLPIHDKKVSPPKKYRGWNY